MAKINALGHVTDINAPNVPQEPVVVIRTGDPELDEKLAAAVFRAIEKEHEK